MSIYRICHRHLYNHCIVLEEIRGNNTRHFRCQQKYGCVAMRTIAISGSTFVNSIFYACSDYSSFVTYINSFVCRLYKYRFKYEYKYTYIYEYKYKYRYNY